MSLGEIYDLPLDALNLYAKTASRLEARRRLGYISDTSAAVASLFGTSEKFKEYAGLLQKQSQGEVDGRRKPNRTD